MKGKATLTGPALVSARRDLCRELPLLMDRAHRLGLHRTGHALHEAVKAIGWETAAAEQKEWGT